MSRDKLEHKGGTVLRCPVAWRLLVSVALLAALPLLSACSLLSDTADPVSETTLVEPTETAEEALVQSIAESSTVPTGGALTYDLFNNGVLCDDTNRPAALVYGAEPGETIIFTSPMPVDIAEGVADEKGAYQLQWRCQPHETALFWDVTATAETSRRSVNFQIRASGDAPAVERELTYLPGKDPLQCNGNRQIVGWIEGAEPGEAIEFSSATTDNLIGANATTVGRVPINWSCQPNETAQSWSVKAVGLSSGRSVSFTIVGAQPDPVNRGPIEVINVEDPFTCDRERRPVAQLTNLTPRVSITFEVSPAVDGVESGTADGNGDLYVFWQCHRSQEGTEWTVTATESPGGGLETRTATFSFAGSATANPTAFTFVEDPFVCDDTSHQLGFIDNFLPGEYVDFTSTDTNQALRQGQAGTDGRLAIRWQCSADDVGRQWTVTATGQTSGLDTTFTITGAANAGT